MKHMHVPYAGMTGMVISHSKQQSYDGLRGKDIGLRTTHYWYTVAQRT